MLLALIEHSVCLTSFDVAMVMTLEVISIWLHLVESQYQKGLGATVQKYKDTRIGTVGVGTVGVGTEQQQSQKDCTAYQKKIHYLNRF